MAHLTRRSILRGSVALGAAHVVAAPHIASRAGHARHPQRLRDRATAPRRGGGDVGAAAGDPAGDRPHAQAPHHGGAAMSTIAADARLASSRALTQTRVVRRRRYLSNAGVALLSVAIVVWSLAPISTSIATPYSRRAYSAVSFSSSTSFSTSSESRSRGLPQPPAPARRWRKTSPHLTSSGHLLGSCRASVSGFKTLSDGVPGRPPARP